MRIKMSRDQPLSGSADSADLFDCYERALLNQM
jgi:hypothetical protein